MVVLTLPRDLEGKIADTTTKSGLRISLPYSGFINKNETWYLIFYSFNSVVDER